MSKFGRPRPGIEFALGIAWNLPLILLIWFSFRTVCFVMSANCFLWAAVCFVFWHSPHKSVWLFQTDESGTRREPNFGKAAMLMLVLGIGSFVGSFSQPDISWRGYPFGKHQRPSEPLNQNAGVDRKQQ